MSWWNALAEPVGKANERSGLCVHVFDIRTIRQLKKPFVARFTPALVAFWARNSDRLLHGGASYALASVAVGAELSCVDVGGDDNFFLSL